MNFGEIVTEVRTNLKDQRADVLASIPDYVNEAYQWIAAETSLPFLKTVILVDTILSQAYTNMPSTFDGRLLYCGTSAGKLTIFDGGIMQLLEEFPDLTEEGDISHIALEGPILWYSKIPTVVTSLICLVYNKPNLLTANTDIPLAIPEYLHREILVNKASAIGYSIIEDGLEGEKPNTMFYETLTVGGKDKLETWVAKRKGTHGRSVWSV